MNQWALLFPCSYHNCLADFSGTIADYYSFGINAIQRANGNMLFVFHDAFLPLTTWATFDPVPNVVLDTHHYEGELTQVTLTIVFGTTFDLSTQLSNICNLGHNLTLSEQSVKTVVGEWSGAQTDCKHLKNALISGTAWLNGYGKGARFDGTFPNSTYHGDCASTIVIPLKYG